MKKLFESFKISKKLSVIFTLIIACFGICIVVSIFGLFRVGGNLDYFYSTPYRNNMAQLQLRRDVQSAMKNILWLSTTTDQAKAKELLAEIEKDVADQSVQLEFLKKNSSATDLLIQLETAMAENKEARNKVMEHAKAGEYQEALQEFNEEYSVKADKVLAILKEVGAFAEQNAENSYNEANSTKILILVLAICISVFTALIAIFLSKFISGLLVRPIMELEKAAADMSEGSLNVSIT